MNDIAAAFGRYVNENQTNARLSSRCCRRLTWL